jgi:hypothetical protein
MGPFNPNLASVLIARIGRTRVNKVRPFYARLPGNRTSRPDAAVFSYPLAKRYIYFGTYLAIIYYFVWEWDASDNHERTPRADRCDACVS